VSRPALAVAAVALGTILFGAAIAARDLVDPWLTNSGAAIVAIALSAAVLRAELRSLLAFRLPDALLAAGLGVLMVAATHLAFRIAVELAPSWGRTVSTLYQTIGETTPGATIAVPLIALIVTAEELLWRGVAIGLTRRRWPRGTAAGAAVALYAAPQLIGGSWVLIAAAVAVGAVFTCQRLLTGRITDPLITHLVWSASIFSLVPLV
jgi:membrane protease YdiL (CAAX protease family)